MTLSWVGGLGVVPDGGGVGWRPRLPSAVGVVARVRGASWPLKLAEWSLRRALVAAGF